jgi:geranylgeranyl reductase family protein
MLHRKAGDFDLVIVGASFAGLAAARTAAARGLRVAVLEAKAEPGARIHTTGILVREAIEEIDIPHHLTRRVPGVRLYSPNLSSIDLFSPGYSFYTTRTAELLRWMAHEAEAAGATILCGRPFRTAERTDDLLRIDGALTTRYLIGADGAHSAVARACDLDRNRRFLIGLEVEVEPDAAVDPRVLHCIIDSKLAPGYLAWIAPGPDVLQLGLAVRQGSKPDLKAFLVRVQTHLDLKLKIVGRRSGVIPCGGPLRRIAAPGVLLIGDAAGWVSPMTGGGIRSAFKYGRRAASLVVDYLQSGGVRPELRLTREVPRYRLKRMLRRAMDVAPPNMLLDLALATPAMRAAAELIYFHKRGAGGVDRAAHLRALDDRTDESVRSA